MSGFKTYLSGLGLENGEILATLQAWRALFSITHPEVDKAVAYVLEKLRQRHRERWKRVAARLLRQWLREPRLMPSRIGFLVESYKARDLREELALTRNSDSAAQESRFLESRLKASANARAAFRDAVADGRVLAPHGVTARFLPEWYFISRPDRLGDSLDARALADCRQAFAHAADFNAFLSALDGYSSSLKSA